MQHEGSARPVGPSGGRMDLMGERLQGTVALVTGASSGIGEATAVELARQGARVAIVARRRDRLDELAKRLEADGAEVLTIEADVTDEAAARGAIEQTVERFDRLDTVIANAGVMLLGPIENAPLEEWQQMVGINVMGLLYTAHAALPHLLDAATSDPRRVADLVLVSSVAGRVPRNGSGVYNLTKHGVGAFGEALRQEVTKRHVRVSLVEPGAVATELAGHNRPEIRETLTTRFQDMQRMDATDIADLIGYIVSRPRHVAINEVLIRPTEQEG
jgi:NADP-dependent 3-hydroxy acid dehydrogenase YdfG